MTDGQNPKPARRAAAQRQGLLIALATLVGTLLLGSVYAYAAPLGTSPDEPDHWRFAYAVASGQQTSDGTVSVPLSLTGFPSACVNMRSDISAACVPRITRNTDRVEVPSPVAGAPPLYYQLVGWPLVIAPDQSGILASRLVSALLSAILWTIAILPWAGQGSWLARLAVLLTAAPAALYFSGSVNPTGMEIAAFAAVWSLSIFVLTRLSTRSYRALPPWVQVAWPTLMMLTFFIRMASGWFLAIVLLVTWLWSATPLRRLLLDRRFMVVTLAVGLTAVFRIATLMLERGTGLFGTGYPPPPADVTSYVRVVSAAWRLLDDPVKAIGLMGWIDTQVPSMGTVVWFMLAGAIAVLATPFVGRRQVAAALVLVVLLGTTWLLLDVHVSTIQNIPFWQARYGFPTWMGLLILLAGAFVGASAAKRFPIVPLFRWAAAIGLAGMQVFSVAYLMIRYMYGAYWFGPVGAPTWFPYAATTVLAATAVVGAIVLGAAVLLPGSREHATDDIAAPSEAGSPGPE